MAKKYEELVISDDFMYGKVSQDLSITKEILEMARIVILYSSVHLIHLIGDYANIPLKMSAKKYQD